MTYKICITTDKGNVKSVNQDSTMAKVASTSKYGKIALGVMCDGMGGLACGEVASTMAIRAMENWFVTGLPLALSRENSTERLDTAKESDIITEIEHQWQMLVQDINKEIREYGEENKLMLGTTMVAIILIDGGFLALNVGDSRIYGITDNDITLLTHDQSLVQDMMDKGLMTSKEAEESPQASVLLQCIGASDVVIPQLVRGEVTKDTSFILCSDGFWRKQSMEELAIALSTRNGHSEEEMKMAHEDLIALVKERGETDNISVVEICANL